MGTFKLSSQSLAPVQTYNYATKPVSLPTGNLQHAPAQNNNVLPRNKCDRPQKTALLFRLHY